MVGRKQPPQVLLFSASFECLEPSHALAQRAKSFTDLIIDRALRTPIVIRVTSNELKLENVTQFFVQVCAHRVPFGSSLRCTGVYDVAGKYFRWYYDLASSMIISVVFSLRLWEEGLTLSLMPSSNSSYPCTTR
jgi:hypothetical protein